MTGAWNGPPGRAGWYAQQDPDGKIKDPDEQNRDAGAQWAETHPSALRRLLARVLRR